MTHHEETQEPDGYTYDPDEVMPDDAWQEAKQQAGTWAEPDDELIQILHLDERSN